jgi:hypothetical protein
MQTESAGYEETFIKQVKTGKNNRGGQTVAPDIEKVRLLLLFLFLCFVSFQQLVLHVGRNQFIT